MNDSWTVLGGSATGSAHVALGKGCEDAHGWFVGRKGICCLVVADGAGSRPRASEGSQAAAAAVVGLAKQLGQGRASAPDQLAVKDLFVEARRRLDEVAAEARVPVDEFATTLAVVLVHDGRVDVGQIGDSIVVLRTGDGELCPATPSERFEYANETVFITSPGWLSHLREDQYSEADIGAVALSTDGLRFKILDDLATGRPYEPFFEDVFAYPLSDEATSVALARFIHGLDDQSGDDKTLIVGVRTDGGGESLKEELVVNDYCFAPPAQAASTESGPSTEAILTGSGQQPES